MQLLEPAHTSIDQTPQSHPLPDADAIRNANLVREGQIRTIGTSIAVAGLVFVVPIFAVALFMFVGSFRAGSDAIPSAMTSVSSVLLLAIFPSVFVVMGQRLNKLEPKSRASGLLACAVAIFCAPPFGLIFGIAGMVILFKSESKQILTPEYARVLEQTPHISSRRSWIIPSVVGLIAVISLLILVVATISAMAEKQ